MQIGKGISTDVKVEQKKGNKNAAKKVKQVTVTSETEEYEEGGNESV